MGDRELLTIPEAARQLGLSRVVLWRLVKRGALPSVEAGPYRLIDAGALARFRAIKREPGRPRKTA